MHEAVGVFPDVWTHHLKASMPRDITADVQPWLCVAWVFQDDNIFKQITKVMMQMGDGDLGGDAEIELPIPQVVLGYPLSFIVYLV